MPSLGPPRGSNEPAAAAKTAATALAPQFAPPPVAAVHKPLHKPNIVQKPVHKPDMPLAPYLSPRAPPAESVNPCSVTDSFSCIVGPTDYGLRAEVLADGALRR
jgi:hypothetical protein